MKTKFTALFFGLIAALALSACGGPEQTEVDIQKAIPSGQNVMDAGDYEVHVNALSTDQITPATADAYGILRSQKRALLNVAMRHKESGDNVEGEVLVNAVNLTGQRKNISMRKIEEPSEDKTAIYYIGVVPVANRETLIFNVTVVLPDTSEPFKTKFKRQFFSD